MAKWSYQWKNQTFPLTLRKGRLAPLETCPGCTYHTCCPGEAALSVVKT